MEGRKRNERIEVQYMGDDGRPLSMLVEAPGSILGVRFSVGGQYTDGYITISELDEDVGSLGGVRVRSTSDSIDIAPGGDNTVDVKLRARSPLPTLNVPKLRELAIAEAVKACHGSITQAAKLLGLGRATVYRAVSAMDVDTKKMRRIW